MRTQIVAILATLRSGFCLLALTSMSSTVISVQRYQVRIIRILVVQRIYCSTIIFSCKQHVTCTIQTCEYAFYPVIVQCVTQHIIQKIEKLQYCNSSVSKGIELRCMQWKMFPMPMMQRWCIQYFEATVLGDNRGEP